MVPVKNGWLALEISTLAMGYVSPSSHTAVSEVRIVERVMNDVPELMYWNCLLYTSPSPRDS